MRRAERAADAEQARNVRESEARRKRVRRIEEGKEDRDALRELARSHNCDTLRSTRRNVSGLRAGRSSTRSQRFDTCCAAYLLVILAPSRVLSSHIVLSSHVYSLWSSLLTRDPNVSSISIHCHHLSCAYTAAHLRLLVNLHSFYCHYIQAEPNPSFVTT